MQPGKQQDRIASHKIKEVTVSQARICRLTWAEGMPLTEEMSHTEMRRPEKQLLLYHVNCSTRFDFGVAIFDPNKWTKH